MTIEGKELAALRALVSRFDAALEGYAGAADVWEAEDNAETRQTLNETSRAFEAVKLDLAMWIAGMVREDAR